MKANGRFNLNSRSGYAVVGVLALAAIYIVALRAIDNGSLWLYALVIALFVFGINRLIKAVRGR